LIIVLIIANCDFGIQEWLYFLENG